MRCVWEHTRHVLDTHHHFATKKVSSLSGRDRRSPKVIVLSSSILSLVHSKVEAMSETKPMSPDDYFPAPSGEVDSYQDVLNFWYPLPMSSSENKDSSSELLASNDREYLNDIAYASSHMPGWMMGGETMDAKCRLFREHIRKTANDFTNKISNDKDDDSLQKKAANLILFDQIARNAFRCEEEAFAYEDRVKDILGSIFHLEDLLPGTSTIPENQLQDFVNLEKVSFCDIIFVAIACQHQEDSMYHGVDGKLLTMLEVRWPDSKDFLPMGHAQSKSHLEVLQRFGRYPHRNHQKGREDTEEEKEWMSDYDNLPHWAKSQLPPPKE